MHSISDRPASQGKTNVPTPGHGSYALRRARGRGCLFAFLLLLLASDSRATAVWIDTDPAIGPPWREVDDAFALILAFHSPALRIAGISSTYGNASLRTTDRVTRDLAERFASGRIPVHRGAQGAGDFAASGAVQALAVALQKQRLTYIALGPLTNLAAFQRAHPRLAQRIDRVLFVGGEFRADSLRFGRGNWLKIHDANVVKDPAAVRSVLEARMPITFAPAEVAAGLMVTPADMRVIARAHPAGRFLARRTGIWLAFWKHLIGRQGGPVFDALAVLAATDPSLVETRRTHVRLAGDLLFLTHPAVDTYPVEVCASFDPTLRARMIERLKASR